MRRTLIASAVGVALCGSAWAGDISQTGGMGDDTLSATSTDTTTTTVDMDASGAVDTDPLTGMVRLSGVRVRVAPAPAER